jgi:hypothetical protein
MEVDFVFQLLVNGLVILGYLRLKDTTSGTRKMTTIMILILAAQLAILGTLAYAPGPH